MIRLARGERLTISRPWDEPYYELRLEYETPRSRRLAVATQVALEQMKLANTDLIQWAFGNLCDQLRASKFYYVPPSASPGPSGLPAVSPKEDSHP